MTDRYVTSTEDVMGPRYPFDLATTLNQIRDHSCEFKFGVNEAVSATEEDVWGEGGTLSLLSSDEQMNIASSSANDTVAGTGARTIVVTGISAGAITSETVILNGTSNVLTTNSYEMIHRMKVLTAGSGGANAGKISATAATAGTVQGCIIAGENQSLQCIYKVPDGKSAIVLGLDATSGKNDDVRFRLRVKEPDEVFTTKWRENIYQAAHTQSFNANHVYPAGSVIKLTAQLISGAGTNEVGGSFALVLVPSSYDLG